MSLPPEFVSRLTAILPPDRLDGVLASFALDKALVVWSNPLRDPTGAAVEALVAAGARLTPIAYTPPGVSERGRAFIVADLAREAVTRSPDVDAGRLYVINPSSLVPPAVLAAEPGDQVLDLCAAPGGKSIQLAARLFSPDPEATPAHPEGAPLRGHLAAVEAIKPRFFKLQAMLQRHGAPRTPEHLRLFLKDGRQVGGAVPERFDRVLIDAPCSSEARFDADDDATSSHWSQRKLDECAYKQRGLLESGLAALRVGGTLVYCTCSFAPEENERVVLDVLARLEGAVVPEAVELPPGVPVMPGLLGLPEARRVLPDGVWDGFFFVRLRKLDHLPGAKLPDDSPRPPRRDAHARTPARGRPPRRR